MSRIEPGQRAAGGPRNRRLSVLAASMVGVGVMAAVDEIVFHQIPAWHHFYDLSPVSF